MNALKPSEAEEVKPRTGGTCSHCGAQDVPVVNTHVWKMIFPLCEDCRECSVRHLENRLVPSLGRLRAEMN